MPNHITNQLTVTGPDAHKVIESCISSESKFDFNKIIPMPAELKDTTSPSKADTTTKSKLVNTYGYDNWYDWSIANWGTKWNCYEVQDVSSTEVHFETAWACPEKVLSTLAQKFPNNTLTIKFADENIGSNCGILTIQGKDISFEDYSIGNLESEETSIRWAMVIVYGSDANYDEYYGPNAE